jgi:hypothetical protein
VTVTDTLDEKGELTQRVVRSDATDPGGVTAILNGAASHVVLSGGFLRGVPELDAAEAAIAKARYALREAQRASELAAKAGPA